MYFYQIFEHYTFPHCDINFWVLGWDFIQFYFPIYFEYKSLIWKRNGSDSFLTCFSSNILIFLSNLEIFFVWKNASAFFSQTVSSCNVPSEIEFFRICGRKIKLIVICVTFDEKCINWIVNEVCTNFWILIFKSWSCIRKWPFEFGPSLGCNFIL